MPLTFSANLPAQADFRQLEQHQASTPASFFDGPPVLYAHVANCQLRITQDGLDTDPKFNDWFWSANQNPQIPDSGAGNEWVTKQNVDVWVSSDSLVFACKDGLQKNNASVQVPYPAVALHAIQQLSSSSDLDNHQIEQTNPESTVTKSLFIQIDTLHHLRSDLDEGADAVTGIFDFNITLPSANTTNAIHEGSTSTETSSNPSPKSQSPEDSIISKLYNALSACADLHPDEQSDTDEPNDEIGYSPGDGFAMPGAGGWITAENADQFDGMTVDIEEVTGDDGVVRILGPGAGTRRHRGYDGTIEDDDGEVVDELNGVYDHEPDTKWQRTS